MKHLKTRTLLLLIVSLILWGQTKSQGEYKEAKFSEPYEAFNSQFKFYFTEGNEILSVKMVKNRVVLQKFSTTNLQEIEKKTYTDFPFEAFRFQSYAYNGVQKIKNKYFLFYYFEDKENETVSLFCREIDFKNTCFIGDSRKIIEVNGRAVSSSIGHFRSSFHQFNIAKSRDESKVIFTYGKYDKTIVENEKLYVYAFCVFDQDLEKIWSRTIKIPQNYFINPLKDFVVDSKGDVYFLSNVFHNNKSKPITKDGKIDYHIELMKFTEEENEPLITKFNLGEKLLNDIWIHEKSDGSIVGVGFSNKKQNLKEYDEYDAQNIFTITFDDDIEIGETKVCKIPSEIIYQNVSENFKTKFKKLERKNITPELENIYLKNIISDEQGNIFVIGEQYYQTVEGTTKNGYPIHRSHYEDILVTKINSKGELVWMKKLLKRQMAGKCLGCGVVIIGNEFGGRLSFNQLKLGENYWFFFIDNIKNKDLHSGEDPEYKKDNEGGCITAYCVNENSGEVSKKYLINLDEFNEMKLLKFFPGRLFKFSEDEVIFEAYKKKKGKGDILVKLKLD